jgi:hypothetical protein
VTEQKGPLESVRRAVDEGDDADDVLRSVVGVLVDEGAATWAGISFFEAGELALGPEAGVPDPNARTIVPVVYESTTVAQLAADGVNPGMLEEIAPLIAEHCLVGWDTGGVPWDEAS